MDKYLIVVICNHGYSEEIMDYAKKSGATGGTILKARGSAGSEVKKFFGITISPEKEVLLVVVTENIKNDVMLSISKNMGVKTEAHSVCFAVKVDRTLGMVENDLSNEE